MEPIACMAAKQVHLFNFCFLFSILLLINHQIKAKETLVGVEAHSVAKKVFNLSLSLILSNTP